MVLLPEIWGSVLLSSGVPLSTVFYMPHCITSLSIGSVLMFNLYWRKVVAVILQTISLLHLFVFNLRSLNHSQLSFLGSCGVPYPSFRSSAWLSEMESTSDKLSYFKVLFSAFRNLVNLVWKLLTHPRLLSSYVKRLCFPCSTLLAFLLIAYLCLAFFSNRSKSAVVDGGLLLSFLSIFHRILSYLFLYYNFLLTI